MQFPCSYFLRSSLLSGHFVEIEFLCCGVIMGISGRTGSFLTASLLKRHKRVFDTRYMDWTTNPDSSSWWFNALCCLSFARQSRNENMVWISSAFLADRIGDGHIYFTSVVWFYRLFCTLFLYLGWLSVFFFSCHLSRSCWWCLHAGFRWSEVSHHIFSIYHLRRKGGRLISQHLFLSFDFTRGVHVCCFSRTWYQTWEAVWSFICSVLILRCWCFSFTVFALHPPSYFYLIWCVSKSVWVYEV